MATYQAKSTNGLSFEVRKDGGIIGSLLYRSWYKFNAVITMADATYAVEPKGFWETLVEIRDGDDVLLSFSMGWKGKIVLRTYFNGDEQDYVFDHRGLFKESFALSDHEGKELLVMKPHLKWLKMNYDYEIVTTGSFETLKSKQILLLAALHCANYYLSMTMATLSM
ncbi:hypothetical protein SAMN05660226_01466 [Parapedobacter luteus]|uniref:Uncharacterized protein n=1 Tax=Parapedobacter luteus TaxID=623280 RepID=A0A1T5BGN5_9SPHI|nr:hypothetical protein [Parapedobacter luteus]SKB46444.1 hypothetical protein SAMN05660226_01466 [Parapedobacter luteus]